MRRLLLLSALLILPAALHAQQFSSLEEKMTHAEFKAAGLDKLSPEELAALNAWLRGQPQARSTAPAVAAPSPEDRVGLREESVRGTVTSRIDGEFTGFTGATRFHLENGQVWEQYADNTRLTNVRLDRPSVTISPGMSGVYYLRVEGYNTRAKVRRVR